MCIFSYTNLYAQNLPLDKFIGIWHPEDGGPTMTISQENGHIIVHVEGVVHSQAILIGNRLELIVMDAIESGKYHVGTSGGRYQNHTWIPQRDDYILIEHKDGSRQNGGPADGFFSNYHRESVGNREIGFFRAHIVYKQDGSLAFYYTVFLVYADENGPLFYQGSLRNDDIYENNPKLYTNR